MKSKHLLRLMRPAQWIKNLFIFLPLFFSGSFTSAWSISQSAIAFIAFCLMASGIYCFNDVHDYKTDAMHSVKRYRPVASGHVRRREAMLLSIILIICSFAVCLALDTTALPSLIILALYLLLNVAYTLKLKQLPILDVTIIAIGFVLRVYMGGLAAIIWISEWLVCMTFLLTLFMAFAKRRDDVVRRQLNGHSSRPSTDSYSLPFVDTSLAILAAAAIICYIIYSLQPEVISRFQSSNVYITSIFVVCGILRFLQLSMSEEFAGSPTRIIRRDPAIQICLSLWILSFVAIIYI